VKQCDDFVRYADYLNHVYMLVHKRRRLVDYWQKRNEIEDVLNLKIDSIYRRVCDRFPVCLGALMLLVGLASRHCLPAKHCTVAKAYRL
jgi:hypothetical protein